jgi:hypothetical protein
LPRQVRGFGAPSLIERLQGHSTYPAQNALPRRFCQGAEPLVEVRQSLDPDGRFQVPIA